MHDRIKRLATSRLTLDAVPGRGVEIITDRDVVLIPEDEVLSLYAWLSRVIGSPKCDARPQT